MTVAARNPRLELSRLSAAGVRWLTPGRPCSTSAGLLALTFAVFWFVVILTLHLWRGRIGEQDELRITALSLVVVPPLALLSMLAAVSLLGSVATQGVVATLTVANSLILLCTAVAVRAVA